MPQPFAVYEGSSFRRFVRADSIQEAREYAEFAYGWNSAVDGRPYVLRGTDPFGATPEDAPLVRVLLGDD